jgi:hypothetical protein
MLRVQTLTDHTLFKQIQIYSQQLMYNTYEAGQNEILFQLLLQLQYELKRRYLKQIRAKQAHYSSSNVNEEEVILF